MSLKGYERERRFDVIPEPRGKGLEQKSGPSLMYVVHKHAANSLHYDFRLEWRGVLLCWAVPKGPSLDPSLKRFALQAEDHMVEYGGFEGVIPAGEYGAGTMMIWDRGTWTPEVPDVVVALAEGELKFTLHGKKLKGSWALVRTRGFGARRGRAWLLIKDRDEYASTEDVSVEQPRSVVSNRLLAGIAADEGGDVAKAGRGDPVPPSARAPSSRATATTGGRKRRRA